MNIYQKLAKIRKPVEILQKNKSGYNYKYVTEDLILAKITGLMDKYGISLIPNILPGTTEVTQYRYSVNKFDKQGNMYEAVTNEILVKADMEWHWVNDENPEERVIVPWTLVGQQADASQAFGSALSYTTRYFLLKYFNVSTSEDDPDAWRSKQKEAAAFEEREAAKTLVEQIDIAVRSALETHPDKKDEIIATIKKHVRDKNKPSANYLTVTDPAVASALLADLAALLES